MDDQRSLSHLVLAVTPEKLPLFTTVLQSGIEITTPGGTRLGQLLGTLPGFTALYLANTVQTIFLNGCPVDDLTVFLSGEKPVIALSAAMPGLAGAIFRKNSFHAALRSAVKTGQADSPDVKPITVTLKLFNTIAQDRGRELFRIGIFLPAEVLSSFFRRNPDLLSAISSIRFDEEDVDAATMLQELGRPIKVHLKILDADTRADG